MDVSVALEILCFQIKVNRKPKAGGNLKGAWAIRHETKMAELVANQLRIEQQIKLSNAEKEEEINFVSEESTRTEEEFQKLFKDFCASLHGNKGSLVCIERGIGGGTYQGQVKSNGKKIDKRLSIASNGTPSILNSKKVKRANRIPSERQQRRYLKVTVEAWENIRARRRQKKKIRQLKKRWEKKWDHAQKMGIQTAILRGGGEETSLEEQEKQNKLQNYLFERNMLQYFKKLVKRKMFSLADENVASLMTKLSISKQVAQILLSKPMIDTPSPSSHASSRISNRSKQHVHVKKRLILDDLPAQPRSPSSAIALSSSSTVHPEDNYAISLLKKSFGLNARFRVGQLEAIRSIVKGNDTFLQQPCGHGKTEIQLRIAHDVRKLLHSKKSERNGLVDKHSTTFIVAPTISLLADQVDQCGKAGYKACLLGIGRGSNANIAEVERNVIDGHYDFVFLSPIKADAWLPKAIQNGMASPNMICYDEAHMALEWECGLGSMSAAYSHLKDLRQRVMEFGAQHFPIVAMTATVRHSDIKELQGIFGMSHVVLSSVLPQKKTMPISIQSKKTFLEDMNEIGNVIMEKKATLKKGEKYKTVIYCQTRNECKNVCEKLKKVCKDINIDLYIGASQGNITAVKDHQDRNLKISNEFINGSIDILVATIAYGMGINQSIQSVILYGAPKSPSEFIQMVHRAGRNNIVATAKMYWSPLDQTTTIYFANSAETNKAKTRKLSEVKAMGDFIKDCRTTCVQKWLTKYFYGKVETKPCGVCSSKECCSSKNVLFNAHEEVDTVVSALKKLKEDHYTTSTASFIAGAITGSVRKCHIFHSGDRPSYWGKCMDRPLSRKYRFADWECLIRHIAFFRSDIIETVQRKNRFGKIYFMYGLQKIDEKTCTFTTWVPKYIGSLKKQRKEKIIEDGSGSDEVQYIKTVPCSKKSRGKNGSVSMGQTKKGKFRVDKRLCIQNKNQPIHFGSFATKEDAEFVKDFIEESIHNGRVHVISDIIQKKQQSKLKRGPYFLQSFRRAAKQLKQVNKKNVEWKGIPGTDDICTLSHPTAGTTFAIEDELYRKIEADGIHYGKHYVYCMENQLECLLVRINAYFHLNFQTVPRDRYDSSIAAQLKKRTPLEFTEYNSKRIYRAKLAQDSSTFELRSINKQRKFFRRNAKEHGQKLGKSAGDGSCYFNSISDIITGASQLRGRVYDLSSLTPTHLRKKLIEYFNNVGNKDRATELAGTGRKAWAQTTDSTAMAHVLSHILRSKVHIQIKTATTDVPVTLLYPCVYNEEAIVLRLALILDNNRRRGLDHFDPYLWEDVHIECKSVDCCKGCHGGEDNLNSKRGKAGVIAMEEQMDEDKYYSELESTVKMINLSTSCIGENCDSKVSSYGNPYHLGDHDWIEWHEPNAQHTYTLSNLNKIYSGYCFRRQKNKRVKVDGTKHETQQCKGVLACSMCNYTRSPKEKRSKDQSIECPHCSVPSGDPVLLQHHTCNVKRTIETNEDANRVTVTYYEGKHEHRRPANRAAPPSLAKYVGEQVLQHRYGPSNAREKLNLESKHPAFTNPDYIQRISLKARKNLFSEESVDGIPAWIKKYGKGKFLRNYNCGDDVIFCQTEYEKMQGRTIAESNIHYVSALYHDATYNGMANSKYKYLVCTSAFSTKPGVGVAAIARGWVSGLTAGHYAAYFYRLWIQNPSIFPDLRRKSKNNILSAVGLCSQDKDIIHMQDFSDAHRRGICMAYAMIVLDKKNISWKNMSEDDLIEKYGGKDMLPYCKGCKFHFIQAAVRASKKRAMIASEEDRSTFIQLCYTLVETESKKKFNKTVQEIRDKFPKLTTAGRRREGWCGIGWLEWWLAPHHGRLIFEAMRDERAPKREWFTTTNNVSESRNSRDKRIHGKRDTSAVSTLHRHYIACIQEQRRHENIARGQTNGYGKKQPGIRIKGNGRKRKFGEIENEIPCDSKEEEWRAEDGGRPHDAESPDNSKKRIKQKRKLKNKTAINKNADVVRNIPCSNYKDSSLEGWVFYDNNKSEMEGYDEAHPFNIITKTDFQNIYYANIRVKRNGSSNGECKHSFRCRVSGGEYRWVGFGLTYVKDIKNALAGKKNSLSIDHYKEIAVASEPLKPQSGIPCVGEVVRVRHDDNWFSGTINMVAGSWVLITYHTGGQKMIVDLALECWEKVTPS